MKYIILIAVLFTACSSPDESRYEGSYSFSEELTRDYIGNPSFDQEKVFWDINEWNLRFTIKKDSVYVFFMDKLVHSDLVQYKNDSMYFDMFGSGESVYHNSFYLQDNSLIFLDTRTAELATNKQKVIIFTKYNTNE